MVDMMILRSVSILTSSEPFSRPDLRSCVPGYSALLSNTTVWQEGSDADMEAGYVVVGNCLHKSTSDCGIDDPFVFLLTVNCQRPVQFARIEPS